jgi:hypothetical protein
MLLDRGADIEARIIEVTSRYYCSGNDDGNLT